MNLILLGKLRQANKIHSELRELVEFHINGFPQDEGIKKLHKKLIEINDEINRLGKEEAIFQGSIEDD